MDGISYPSFSGSDGFTRTTRLAEVRVRLIDLAKTKALRHSTWSNAVVTQHEFRTVNQETIMRSGFDQGNKKYCLLISANSVIIESLKM
jgi:peptide deformylase